MSKVIKPMLATKADMDKIKYPVLVTPKLDGIRCLMVDGVAMSRSMKPIPNKHVRDVLSGLNYLDGELMTTGDFNAVHSGIMAVDGEPNFTYCVFDSYENPNDPYESRIDNVFWECDHPNIKFILPELIMNEGQLLAKLEEYLSDGYEGLMMRQADGPYKFGRGTVNQGWLLKLKKFIDDEGEFVRFTERMTNGNALEEDELGYAKRSSHKDNLIPANTAGAVIIKWNNLEFSVGFGPGFTDAIKQELWDNRHSFDCATLIKFSYQELSGMGIPRFGKMIGIRHEDDL